MTADLKRKRRLLLLWVAINVSIVSSILLNGAFSADPDAPISVDDATMDRIQNEMAAEAAKGAHFRDDPLDSCGDPCVIREDLGGHLISYVYAVRTLSKRKKFPVEIDGDCFSGCATFAAYSRPRVCVTPRAVMGFHRSSSGSPQPLPADLRAWVLAHGGFPPYEENRVTKMRYPVTARFWKTCWVD